MNVKTITFAGRKHKVHFEHANWICDGKEGWDGSSRERSWDIILQGGYNLGRCRCGNQTGWQYEINGRRYVNEKRMFEGELELLASNSEEWAKGEINPFFTR